MKWIKSRSKFLNEAKIRDVILPRQAKQVAKQWGEKYLDYEEVDPTPNIKQGKWKISEEDKKKVMQTYFDCDLFKIYKDLSELPDKFNDILSRSIKLEMLDEKNKAIMSELNIKNPTITQLVFIFNSVFRKLSVSETQSTEIIQRDENGRPVRDEEGNMLKTIKEAGEPIFSNNLVNITSFLEDYNRCYDDDQVSISVFRNGNFENLRNMSSIDENREYKLVDFDIFGKDLYLSILHNPRDILNMSISKFYSSCQHLYSGGYREQVLGNVFDPNSIPAYLLFDTPIFHQDEKISEHLPLSRMMLRNIESFDVEDGKEEKKILFDRAYPDRMKNIFCEIVEKYSDNKRWTGDYGHYTFTPDVPPDDEIRAPYMDIMSSPQRIPFIGKNTKSLYLTRSFDWSRVKISPAAKVEEIVIETTKLPEGFEYQKLNPKWIKFKYLKINSLGPFKNIITDSIAFDKCKIESGVINEISSEIKKIQFISCDIPGDLDLNKLINIEELQVIYSANSLDEILKNELGGVKKLVISGDLIKSKEDKLKLNQLKRSGKKIEIVGPVI